MALPQIISRNISQKIPSFEINGRVVIQPNTWYTCPTGKKAIIKGKVSCTGLGAAADVDFVVASVIMFTWDRTTAVVDNAVNAPQTLTTGGGGQFAEFEVELAAGETLVTQQNTGTNAEINLFASVIETSV